MKKLITSFVLLCLSIFSKALIMENRCADPVWPVAASNAGTPSQVPTSFVLQPGESDTISLPPSWSGSIWGRTGCSIEDSGAFHCLTGGCGSHTVGCGGESDLLQPASTSIAAFWLNATDGMHYYEVSLRNGFNLPIMVSPLGRNSGGDDEHHCTVAGCVVNLISACPPELRYSDESLGCKRAFSEPSFCCSTCNCSHNRYTQFFKRACPRANSFANDKTSTFSCPFEHDFVIIFCPSSSTTRLTSPDYKFPTESESDSEGKINYNSKKRNKYKIPALISGALALVGALSTAVWWFNAAGSTNCCQINIFLFQSSRREGLAGVAFRRDGEENENEREREIEIAVPGGEGDE